MGLAPHSVLSSSVYWLWVRVIDLTPWSVGALDSGYAKAWDRDCRPPVSTSEQRDPLVQLQKVRQAKGPQTYSPSAV